ncbi:MAG: cation diffusion facilitator family transporter [Oscillospiraceae bacterium]|jgi:cation diffusion facilitator family transporter
MKLERKCLIISMINNLLISIIKVSGGIIFHVSSLFADGLHTFSDFITDIFALIGSKISRKRPTKIHPFGFGRAEYITNLLIGVIIILLGIFILVTSFFKEPIVPSLAVIGLLIGVTLMKLYSVSTLLRNGEKLNSGLLLTAAKESMTDVYSSIGVVLVVIVMQFSNYLPILEYADILGSIIISLLVIKTGIPIIKQNVMNLIGEVDIEKTHLESIENILNNYEVINKHRTQLIKYGSYYKTHLTLELDPNITLREISDLENKLTIELKKNKTIKIKYINIDVVPTQKSR